MPYPRGRQKTGDLMEQSPNRQCLPCTACCQGWLSADILGFAMGAGRPCPHSSPAGCGIYEDRPQDPCRTYVCSWLVDGSPLPDWMRPDQSGVIVLLSLPWEGEKVISAIPVGQTIPERPLEWLKNYAQKYKRPLIFYERLMEGETYTGVKQTGFGPPEFRRKVAEMGLQPGERSIPMLPVE